MRKSKILRWLPVFLAGCGCGFLVVGCGGGGDDEASKIEEHEKVLVEIPPSGEEAIRRVRAAVAGVEEAGGAGALDRAALLVEAEVEAAAECFLEKESDKIGRAVERARFRGAVQNLRMLAKQMHSLAHQGVERQAVEMMGRRVELELEKLSKLMVEE